MSKATQNLLYEIFKYNEATPTLGQSLNLKTLTFHIHLIYNMYMKNLSEETKTKLVYSGELIIIAIVFLVLGILKIVDVMKYNEQRRLIFNYITLVGGVWVISDFIWMLLSKKRRAKNCLLDKILNLPLGIYLLIFDIQFLSLH